MQNALSIEHITFAFLRPLVHTATRSMPCHCVIFQIGERVILLDTGFGTREMLDPNRLLGEDALFKLGIGMQYRAFDRNNADEVRSFAARLANDHTLRAIVSRRGNDSRALAKTCLRQTLTTFSPARLQGLLEPRSGCAHDVRL